MTLIKWSLIEFKNLIGLMLTLLIQPRFVIDLMDSVLNLPSRMMNIT